MEKKIVIAKNFSEYIYYSKKFNYNRDNSIYINSREQLLGLRLKRENILKIGQWYERSNIGEIEEELDRIIL